MTTPTTLEEALAEIDRLRQGLWQCAVEAGIDTDGDTKYHGPYPEIVDFALIAVRDLRRDYNECLDEIKL